MSHSSNRAILSLGIINTAFHSAQYSATNMVGTITVFELHAELSCIDKNDIEIKVSDSHTPLINSTSHHS